MATKYPSTVDEMLALSNVPVVAINQNGIFTYINNPFVTEYGWTEDDLLGESVVKIMPKTMHSGHNVGFSRFLTTESSELLGKPLPLKVLYKDGREKISEHFIMGDKINGQWRFSAIIDYPI
jgi:PAS domain S-box-containing protein